MQSGYHSVQLITLCIFSQLLFFTQECYSKARESLGTTSSESGSFITMNIGISSQNLTTITTHLNLLLADEYTLYTKTLNYHWNILGIQFHDLHVFFRHQYEELFQITDDVAERVRTLGAPAFGTLGEFRKNTRLSEEEGKVPDSATMIKNLLNDHESVIRTLRSDIKTCQKHEDEGTANFLTDLMEKHEKMAWMLRTFLQK